MGTIEDRCSELLPGLLVVVLVAVTWTAVTQFTRASLTVEPDVFYAPMFLMWIGTACMILSYPIFFLYCKIPVVLLPARENFEQSLKIYSKEPDVAQSRKYILVRAALITTPLMLLWVVVNYVYSQALGRTAASHVTAMFATDPAFVFILSLCLVRGPRIKPVELILKAVAVLLAAGGVFCVAMAQGLSETKPSLLGLGLALLSASGAAFYKVCFGRIAGAASLGQVSIFMTTLGILNLFIIAPVVAILYLMDVEVLTHIPWFFVIGVSILFALFNFLVNFGIALVNPLFISVGFFLGIPLNAVADLILHGTMPKVLELVGGALILLSFSILLFSPLLFKGEQESCSNEQNLHLNSDTAEPLEEQNDRT